MLRFYTCIATLIFLAAIQPAPLHAEQAVQAPATDDGARLSVQATDRFQSNPLAAEVFINHKLVGTTPIELALPAGQHDLRVAADGYDPFVRRVTLDRKQTLPIHAQLDVGEGSVEFQASVPGAEITINKAQPMMLPIRIGDLPEGTHRWEVSAPGYEPESGKLDFVKGKNLFFYAELTSSAGIAEFTSSPEGADIYVDMLDSSIGQTPLRLEDLEADEHMVLLRKKGYATVLRSMDTSMGNKGDVHARLPKSGADITVRTSEEDAKVYVRGMEMGQGRKISLGKLEEGLYEFSVRSEGSKPIYTEVHVPSSGRMLYVAEMAPGDASQISRLQVRTPLLERWYFWAGVAGAATASGVSGFLVYLSLQPEPAETGDVIVPLP